MENQCSVSGKVERQGYMLEIIIIPIAIADNIFCYWDMMSLDRRLHTNFRAMDVESKYCTHLIYGSLVQIGANGLEELNAHNPHCKYL